MLVAVGKRKAMQGLRAFAEAADDASGICRAAVAEFLAAFVVAATRILSYHWLIALSAEEDGEVRPEYAGNADLAIILEVIEVSKMGALFTLPRGVVVLRRCGLIQLHAKAREAASPMAWCNARLLDVVSRLLVRAVALRREV